MKNFNLLPILFILLLLVFIFLSKQNTIDSHEKNISNLAGAPQPTTIKCSDGEPYWDESKNKCVECLIDNNCVIGFERCYQNKCIKKNSPQCAFYPVGILGQGIV
jgi:hypothetical protein